MGCANFAPVWGDKKRTLAKIEANVVEAATQGIDIIAFPEESLTGTSRCDACRAEGHACDEHLEEAETVPGPATDHVADLAREHDVYVLFGLPGTRRPASPASSTTRSRSSAPKGLLGTYHKVHLGALPWVLEGMCSGRVRACPCSRPASVRSACRSVTTSGSTPSCRGILALKGARLIVNCCGTFAGPGKRDYMVNTTSVRAQENLVYTASANLVGGPDGPGLLGREPRPRSGPPTTSVTA